MPAYNCSACNRQFTLFRGLQSHLRTTTDVLCRQVYAEMQRKNQPLTSAPQSLPNPEPIEDLSQDGAPFAGDHFGSALDYADETFGQEPLQATDPLPAGGESMHEEDADSESSDDEAELVAELEAGWEAERGSAPTNHPEPQDVDMDAPPNEDEGVEAEVNHVAREAEKYLIGEGHGIKPKVTVRYSDKYPNAQAGQPLSQREDTDARYTAAIRGGDWAPFQSKIDWEIARWAKLRGPGSTAFSELLAIDGVQKALGLSYKTSEELNRTIDSKLPGHPQFHRREVVIQGEAMELYSRDIMECLCALWGDPDFAGELIFEPERAYADDDENIRLYHGMESGKWWWKTQVQDQLHYFWARHSLFLRVAQKVVESTTGKTKCTIVPIIISSDKTQLTQFRNKSAYPVYMTIGNIPKHVRRKPSRQGQVLLAYLPTSRLSHITNKASRRRAVTNLFHHCMKIILQPLEQAGRTGVVLVGGDGAARLCFPIYATFVGDYPEQVLVTLVKSGRCPVCPAPHEGIGSLESIRAPRDAAPIKRALRKIKDGPLASAKACTAVGIKPVQDPFWLKLPYLNIYEAITPNILHQIYQGVFKHVLHWIYTACGEAEIDARCRRLPPNHNITLFLKGITQLSRVTGTQHDEIARFLLGLIVDIRLPDGMSNARLVRAVRGLLDFIYLAKYPVHTTQMLENMDNALQMFYDNLDIFIELGIRENFDIPKFHFTGHYRPFVELYGTTDNFNTEYTERLYIDLAKRAYAATNKKDEYPQMTTWLERHEKILHHEKYLRRRTAAAAPVVIIKPLPSLIPLRHLRMAKHPTIRAVTFDDVRERYGATQFEPALCRFVAQYQNPTYSKAQVAVIASTLHISFYKIPVFHRLKFWSNDVFALDPLAQNINDSLHVQPSQRDKYNNVIPGRFDVALIKLQAGGPSALTNFRAARVRCIFSLPPAAVARWFPQGFPHKHLAYVEWFTPFTPGSFEPNSKMYRISPLVVRGTRMASIVPVTLIEQSLHLFPKFGPIAPSLWKASNVLDMSSIFYVNPFSDRFQYCTVY